MNNNDYELVNLAQEGNEIAINTLYQKYLPIINRKSNSIYKYIHNRGTEKEDIIQECMLAFEESIRKFNQNKDGNFNTFTNICMNRKLINYVRELGRNKHKLLNESISLNAMDEEDLELIDIIEDSDSNPEDSLIEYEEYIGLYNNIIDKLTYFEECIFVLRVKGFSYEDIASVLDKDEKSINNAIRRIRLKVGDINV